MPAGGGNTGGGGASSGAVRAGGAFVEIFANDGPLRRGLAAAQTKLQAFGNFVSKLGKTSLVMDAAQLGAFVTVFAGAVSQAADMKLLADQVGTTTERISALAYAFGTVSVNAEQFADMMKGLQQHLFDAAEGNDKFFKDLGLNAKKLIDLTPEEQIKQIGDALLRVPEGARRSGMAMKIFGDQGVKALRLLSKGPEHFADMLAEAGRVGAVISSEQAQQAEEIERAWRSTWMSIKAAVLEVGRALFPHAEHLQEMGKSIQDIARSVRNWITLNKDLVEHLMMTSAAFVAFDIALIVIGGIVGGIGTIIGAFGSLITFVASGVAFILSPLGLFAAAVATIGTVFLTQTQSGQLFADRVGALFGELGKTAKDAWGGIVAAIKKGDLQLAFEIGAKAIKIVWLELMEFLKGEWDKFKKGWQEGLNDLGKNLKGFFENFRSNFSKGLNALKDGETRRDVWQSILEDLGIEERKTVSPDTIRGFIGEDAFKARQNAAANKPESEIERAKRELAELVNKANQVEGPRGGPSGSPIARDMGPALANAVKGAFTSPNFAQALGVGDTTNAAMAVQIAKGQLKVAEKQLEVEENHAEAAFEANDVLGEIDKKLKSFLNGGAVFE